MNRDVQLIIRAKDEGSKAIQAAASALESLLDSGRDAGSVFGAAGGKVEQFASVLLQIDRAASKVGGANSAIASSISKQAQAVHAASAELKVQQTRVQDLTRALGLMKAEADKAFVGPKRNGLDETIKNVEKQLRSAEKTVATLQGKIDKGLSGISVSRGAQRDSQKNADALGTLKGAAEIKEMDAAAARLRAQLNPLVDIEARLAAEQAKLNGLFKAGKISAVELDGGMKLLAADADRAKRALGNSGIDSRGRPSLLGLKPYELQNLTFQVNDFFTQLASGTSVSQAFAQQIGQVIQLFPKLGDAIIAGLRSGPILATVATVGLLVAALGKAQDQMQVLRTFDGLLRASADGGRYQAQGLADAARELDRYGLTAEQAVQVTRVFLKEGVRPDLIVAFGQAARDMSVVLGTDVKDAAQQVAQAFTHGYESIKKFDDGLNFLSASERAHIRLLFEEGKAQEARSEALRLFSERQEDAASQMRGPWADAVNSLSNAWESFIRFLSNNSVITTVAGAINLLAESVDGLFTALDRAGGGSGSRSRGSALPAAASLDDKIKEREGAVANLQKVIAQDKPGRSQTLIAGLNAELKVQQDLLAGLKKERDKAIQLQGKENAALRKEIDALRDANKELDAGARLKRAYNEALLDVQERFPNASPAEQAAFAAQAELRVQKQITEERKRQAEELARQAQDPVLQTVKLLKGLEGFQGKAKWDVNAFRLGFGSDTMTGTDGSVTRVTAGSKTTMEGALRDLERRAREFLDATKEQVGSDRFGSFSPQQQAALASIAYNYGSLPERIINAVRTGTAEEISSAVRGLAKDNGGINSARRNREADILGAPNMALEADTRDQQEDLLKKQDEYLGKLDATLLERRLEIGYLEQIKGKTGEALESEERRVFIAKELAKARADAAKADLPADDARLTLRLKEVEATAAAYYDLANARKTAEAARDRVTQPVDNLTAQRDSITQQMTFLRDNGMGAEADALLPRLDDINVKLQEAIDKAIAFYQALSPEDNALGLTAQQIETMVSSLQTAKLVSQEWGTVMGLSARQIAQAFASTATNAFNKFLQAVSEGQNAFKAAKSAFLEFAASFLQMIAQMIIQQLAFAAATAILKAMGVAVPTNHSGGIVGRDSSGSRKVSPLWFAGAMRYHKGGIAGLKPNEVPTILERGEEVLTRSDPRHRANGGLDAEGGGGMPAIKVINAIDAGNMVEQGLNSKAGERAFLNFIRNNSGALKQAMS